MKTVTISDELHEKLEEEAKALRDGAAKFVQGTDPYEGKRLQIVSDPDASPDNLTEHLLTERVRYHRSMREYREKLLREPAEAEGVD